MGPPFAHLLDAATAEFELLTLYLHIEFYKVRSQVYICEEWKDLSSLRKKIRQSGARILCAFRV
jgi:hypothetical protein